MTGRNDLLKVRLNIIKYIMTNINFLQTIT